MFVYTPTDATGKIFPGDVTQRGLIKIGDDPVLTKKLVYPVPAGFELTGYGDAPWDELFADTPPAALTDLIEYSSLLISNDTGAVVSCVANGDTANPLPIMDKQSQSIELNDGVSTLDITGDGTGTLYVTGVLK